MKNSEKKLFVACQNELTERQDWDWNWDWEGDIISLKELSPKLQDEMGCIPNYASLEYMKELATKIVAKAVEAGATHFFCTGSPTFVMWANLFASGTAPLFFANKEMTWEEAYKTISYKRENIWSNVVVGVKNLMSEKSNIMVCLESVERLVIEDTNENEFLENPISYEHSYFRDVFND